MESGVMIAWNATGLLNRDNRLDNKTLYQRLGIQLHLIDKLQD